jgi:molybdopterin synthase catalytic subunit
VDHLTSGPIDVAALVAAARRDSDGAVATFVGVVRDHNAGIPVRAIEYTAYAEMAESEMARIGSDLERELPGTRVRLIHRLGLLRVGEVSVAVVAVSAHREEAFRACREAIERLKKTVPIWKKES